MPGRDGTGPHGRGSMSGRAAGRCAGEPDPVAGPEGVGFGRGLGRGGNRGGRAGAGWGWGRASVGLGAALWERWAGRRADPTSEQLALEQEASNLRAELERIQSRLAEFPPREKSDLPSRD
ncbi:MAG: DUF5320 domain-containing protein [Vicinamibacterales bacterium]|nr:DUF5320 domain-containing protein [Vicinamibacterales bacterium]